MTVGAGCACAHAAIPDMAAIISKRRLGSISPRSRMGSIPARTINQHKTRNPGFSCSNSDVRDIWANRQVGSRKPKFRGGINIRATACVRTKLSSMMDRSPRLMHAAAALVVALGVAGCSAPEPRTPEQQVADRVLAGRVEAALRANPYVDVDHVTIDVNRGIVTVSGLVGDEWDWRRALQICEAVPGVQRVIDRLELIEYGSHRGD